MQPNKLREVNLRVSVHLITGIVVLVVAIVFAACAKNSNQNNSNVPKTVTTPSPSPSPSGTPQYERVPGDTIIVIRDGSVRMKVNKENNLCGDDANTGNDKNYKCGSVMLKEIGIQSIDGPRCVTLNENSRITIDGGGQAGKDIKIHKNGNDVKIQFKDAEYPQCTGGRPGEHCNEGNHVGTISVDNPAFSKVCSPDDKCEFWIRIGPR